MTTTRGHHHHDQPRHDTDDDGLDGVVVVERLPHGNDHRHEDPDGHGELNQHPEERDDAEHIEQPGRLREPHRSEHLPEVGLRVLAGKELRPDQQHHE
jgi:hypothetical protein